MFLFLFCIKVTEHEPHYNQNHKQKPQKGNKFEKEKNWKLKAEKNRNIQFGIFTAEIFEHVLVRSTEVVDIGFSERRTRKLDV